MRRVTSFHLPAAVPHSVAPLVLVIRPWRHVIFGIQGRLPISWGRAWPRPCIVAIRYSQLHHCSLLRSIVPSIVVVHEIIKCELLRARIVLRYCWR